MGANSSNNATDCLEETVRRQRETILKLTEKLAQLQQEHSELCEFVSQLSAQRAPEPVAKPPK